MKVLLIEPPIMDYRGGNQRSGGLRSIAMDACRECPPYGIYMLSSVLRAAGHEVVLADLIAAGTHRVAQWQDDVCDCDLIGIGATSMSWPTAVVVIRQIRRMRKDVPIVLGGIHPTMFGDYILKTFPVQYVVRGEGEIALQALCRALESPAKDVSQVPNLSWRDAGGRVVRNSVAPKMTPEDIGAFPLPDYSVLPAGVYKGLAIESSRGCAFDCSFCSTSYRRSWRGIPAETFVDRLEVVMQHVDRTRFRTVHIIDDEFSMNPRRAIQIGEIIADRNLEQLSKALVYDSRATDLLYPGYVETIAPLTCQFLVGAECGYDEGLKLIGKGTTCDILERAAEKLARFGIADRADFSFILGLPWEGREEIERTLRFSMRLHALYGVRVLLQWYCQIPGSRLWEDDRQAGLVNETMYNDFGFFRDLHMFRSAVRVSPQDVWEIGEIVQQLKGLTSWRAKGRRMVEFAFPQAVYDYYPYELINGERSDGLKSLREVSRIPKASLKELTVVSDPPPAIDPGEVGIPQRHFVGHR